MSLAPGTRVGAYEVIGSLGAGGMGEVYRARDLALGRDVAIKILPDHFVSDTDRLARFEREARTLASLNHSGIAQIYGMEAAAGAGQSRALVMELVEGEDLSAIIARGRIPMADALPIAKQIAQALEAAHEAGVVHRDLKPANIKVRGDGTVKILDFGLAKAIDHSGVSSANLAHSPTITSAGTQFGTLIGTAAYMSPEQARGKAVDRRADVWAFGVILYEMLSGRRLFGAAELSDVLASVLKDTIPLETLPGDTPASIRRLLRRCLEKNRGDRLDSMGTARLEIADAMSSGEQADRELSRSARPMRPRFRIYAAIMAAGILLGLPAGWLSFRPAPAAADRVVRFSISLPPGVVPESVAITNSGTAIVYETDRLYLRGLADAEARAIPGTEGGRMVFLSPDGRWAGFYAGGKIKKVALAGGEPLAIADAAIDTPGAGWGPNNSILFSSGWNGPLYSVSADGGSKPVAVSTVDVAAGELGHWWPHLLPDGKTVLFTIWMAAAGINDSRIGALDLATGKHRVLMPGAYARYLSSGHLLYFHAGTYQVVSFDPVALAARGDPVNVLPDAQPLSPGGGREKTISVADAGALVYIAGPLAAERSLHWMSSSGVTEALAGSPRRWGSVMLAPDSRRVAGATTESGVDVVWLRDLARGTDQRVEAPGSNFSPMWSPTGDFLLFTSLRAGHFDVSRLGDDGRVSAVIDEPFDQEAVGITHDGKRMVLFDYVADGSMRLTAAEIDRPKERRVLQTPPTGSIRGFRLSPDDQWMAFADGAAGRSEIVVYPFGSGPGVRVSARGGEQPRWSKTGSTLYYQRDDELIAVSYAVAGGRFTIQREAPVLRLNGGLFVDVAADGRFLVSREAPGQSTTLQIVVNWFAELKQ